MNFLRSTVIKSVSGLVVGVSLLTVPLAFAYASVSVSIQSLSPSTNISVGTNVSFSVSASGFTSPTYTINDSASGSSVSSGNINSSGNFSWTPVTNDIGTHNLTIAVNDSMGDSATTTETLTVSAAPSVSIQSLSPSSNIISGQTVSFTASATGFSSPSYSVSDSFSGSSISNSNINSSGNFSWTPGSNQNGTHTITILVSDSSGHSVNATETITVSSTPTVVIQSLSPGSNVNIGQTMTFLASASGFSSPTYSLSDSFGGTTISNNNINSSGNFSWAPSSSDIGSHTITVTAQDGSGHSATATQTITVGGSGATIQGLSPGNTVVVGNPVTFTVAASGFTNPVFTAQDSFSGSSASNSNLNSGGYFSWTPNSNDVGTHNFTIYVNDSSGHTGNVTVSVAVQTPTIAITSINPGSVITPNTVFTFNVTPSGFTNPSYTVADSFSGTSITNSNLNSSGYFNWTPASNQIGSHTITVYATDSAGHSANTSYTVNVNSGVSVSVSLPSPSTYIAPGSGVSFQAYPYGFYTPTYSIQDSFGGTSISSSNINNSGAFYWTPNASDVGTHTLTITANDSYGHTATTQTTITVSTTGTVGTNNQTLIASLRAQLAQLLSQIAAIQQGQGTTSSSTGARHIFSTFLTVGSHGSEVSALQQYLTSLGLYSGPINGSYGQLTRRGVMLFQSRHGIKQAGYVGPSTRDALNQ